MSYPHRLITKKIRQLLCLLLLSCLAVNAQTKPDNKYLSFNTGLAFGHTYTGFNAYLTLSGKYLNHQVYVGPKLLLTNGMLPKDGRVGFYAGYNYALISKKRWSALAGLDYQLSRYRPFNPYKIDNTKTNKIHELQVLLGIRYNAVRRLSAEFSVGSGLFMESFHDLVAGSADRTYGKTSLIRIAVNYQLIGK